MSLVTVKPKFQITIPAKLRRGLDLHEGDLLEATVIGDGILFRPKQVVDRNAVADRVAAVLARIEPAPEDIGRSEDEIMEDVLADIAAARKERRVREAVAAEDLSTAEIEAIRRTEPPVEAAQYDHEMTGERVTDT